MRKLLSFFTSEPSKVSGSWGLTVSGCLFALIISLRRRAGVRSRSGRGVGGSLSSSSSSVPEGSDSSSWSRGPDTLGVASLGSGVSLSSAAEGGSQAADHVIGIVAGVYTRLEVQIYCQGPIQSQCRRGSKDG